MTATSIARFGIPAFNKADPFDPEMEEPTDSGFWRKNRAMSGPKHIRMPSIAQVTRYHRELRIFSRELSVSVECHWGAPKDGKGNVILAYGYWNPDWKDLEYIGIPLRLVSNFNVKVRWPAPRASSTRRKRMKRATIAAVEAR